MNCPQNIKTCIDYTLEILLGKDYQNFFKDIKIVYGKPKDNSGNSSALYIIPGNFFGENYGTGKSLPKLPLKEIEGVPLLFGSPVVERKGNQLVVYADIIASAYFLLTRYEEIVRRDVRDRFGRFPGRESLPCRAGFICRPIVEEYAALLRKWLREIDVYVPQPSRKFSVLLTHDIDFLRKCENVFQLLRTTAGIIIGRQPIQNLPRNLAAFLGLKSDPYDTFEQLIALDKSINNVLSSESVYFFMAGAKKKFDAPYDIRSQTAKKTIEMVCKSGAAIGLHASYQVGIFPDLIEEKNALEEVCGFPINRNRYHYLMWREVEDGWALNKAGITWDSTLGYADVAGFRLGVCRPIPLFDPVRMELFGIEEHPLIVMDVTLSGRDYMNVEMNAINYCKGLIEQTYKHNGEFVILWHNTSLAQETGSYHAELYEQLLADLCETNSAFGEKDNKWTKFPVAFRT